MTIVKTVIVGSMNPVKIDGVKQGFEKLFPDASFEFKGHNAASGVPDQPMGSEETLNGALNRAKNCQSSYPNADFFCGLEGGILTDSQGDMGTTAWVVVIDHQGRVGKGLSSLHILPPKVVALVKEGHELGVADDMTFRKSNSKQSGGSIGLLTEGIYTRTDKMVEAVVNALVPHKNPQFYFLD